MASLCSRPAGATWHRGGDFGAERECAQLARRRSGAFTSTSACGMARARWQKQARARQLRSGASAAAGSGGVGEAGEVQLLGSSAAGAAGAAARRETVEWLQQQLGLQASELALSGRGRLQLEATAATLRALKRRGLVSADVARMAARDASFLEEADAVEVAARYELLQLLTRRSRAQMRAALLQEPWLLCLPTAQLVRLARDRAGATPLAKVPTRRYESWLRQAQDAFRDVPEMDVDVALARAGAPRKQFLFWASPTYLRSNWDLLQRLGLREVQLRAMQDLGWLSFSADVLQRMMAWLVQLQQQRLPARPAQEAAEVARLTLMRHRNNLSADAALGQRWLRFLEEEPLRMEHEWVVAALPQRLGSLLCCSPERGPSEVVQQLLSFGLTRTDLAAMLRERGVLFLQASPDPVPEKLAYGPREWGFSKAQWLAVVQACPSEVCRASIGKLHERLQLLAALTGVPLGPDTDTAVLKRLVKLTTRARPALLCRAAVYEAVARTPLARLPPIESTKVLFENWKLLSSRLERLLRDTEPRQLRLLMPSRDLEALVGRIDGRRAAAAPAFCPEAFERMVHAVSAHVQMV